MITQKHSPTVLSVRLQQGPLLIQEVGAKLLPVLGVGIQPPATSVKVLLQKRVVAQVSPLPL